MVDSVFRVKSRFFRMDFRDTIVFSPSSKLAECKAFFLLKTRNTHTAHIYY
jgi:hypothetical protein